MKRRPSEQTKVVVAIIEARVSLFTGEPTIPLDDIVVEFRAQIGGRLDEAKRRVSQSLPSALRLLHDDGMFSTRVTEYYWTNRNAWGPHHHPVTQRDIVRSVAVSSGGAGTYALHFCPSDDCELFMQAFDHNATSGERKVAATVSKMRDMAEAGLLTPDGIAKVATNAGLQPRKDVTKVMRIAARVNQQRLTEKAS
jgi:hypothetical protein